MTPTQELREAALLQAQHALQDAWAGFVNLAPESGPLARQMQDHAKKLSAALSAIEAAQGDSVHLASGTPEGVSGSDVPARPTSPAEDRAAFEAWWDDDTSVPKAPDGYSAFKLHALAGWQARGAQEQGAVPQWMPIETAPKDGSTLLLGYRTRHGRWHTLRGNWFSAEDIADSWEDDAPEGWYETSVEKDDPPNCWWTDPTHWMPLPPAPPVADPGQAGKGETK